MSLNFVQFINDNTSFTPEKNQAMLDDLASYFGYSDQSELTKVEFVNKALTENIKAMINKQRRREAKAAITYETFDIIEEVQE